MTRSGEGFRKIELLSSDIGGGIKRRLEYEWSQALSTIASYGNELPLGIHGANQCIQPLGHGDGAGFMDRDRDRDRPTNSVRLWDVSEGAVVLYVQ